MKRANILQYIFILTALILFPTGLLAQTPQVSGVSVSGTTTVGSMLTGSYTFDANGGDATDNSAVQWYRDGVIISGANTSTYPLVVADEGARITFGVLPVNGTGDVGDLVISPPTAEIAPALGSAPTATMGAIIGTLTVGQELTGVYTHNDTDGDAEGSSTYQWYRDGSPAIAIPGATNLTYTLSREDEGESIFFEVTPVSLTGTPKTGSSYQSAAVGPVSALSGTAPVATNAGVSGTTRVGETLTGIYTYSDVDNDLEGGSTYRWLRDGSVEVSTLLTYTLVIADEGHTLVFEVTPVSATGIPTDGSPVQSSETAPVSPQSGSAPTATMGAITGTPAVGQVLTGVYTHSDTDGDAEGSSTYQWYRDGSPATAIPGATSLTYTLINEDEGESIFFEVTPVSVTGIPTTGSSYQSSVVGPVNAATGTAPYATQVNMIGVQKVGQILTGIYTYNDDEGDAEGSSSYRWLKDGSPIPGAQSLSYTLVVADEGSEIQFEVTPVAATGLPVSDQTFLSPASSPISPAVGAAPTASAVTISGSPTVGEVLNGSYSYGDADGDAEGTTTFRWLRDGSPITGETGTSYTLQLIDEGSNISFEVTPVALTGSPKTGVPAESPAVLVTPASSVAPTALNVCISGIHADGEVLTAAYDFFDPEDDEEGSSIYQWHVDDSPILGANALTYTLQLADIGKKINFEVTPVAKTGSNKIGSPVMSEQLAWFELPSATVNVVSPPVDLVGTPAAGVFSGTGVVSADSKFYPDIAGVPLSPHTITYTYSDPGGCSNSFSSDIIVTQAGAYFESVESVYCYGEGSDQVVVRNLPSGSTGMTFTTTTGTGIMSVTQDTIATINPDLIGAGEGVDSIRFQYINNFVSYRISVALTIDSVGTDIDFINLDSQYCDGDPVANLTVTDIYPSGGNGSWTGAGLISTSTTSAVFDPDVPTPDQEYTITYQYTSALGCSGQLIEKQVQIDTLPVLSFPLKDNYNKAGDPEQLIPNITGGSFSGSGISGDVFYPELLSPASGIPIRYTFTDGNGCTNYVEHTTSVRVAQGSLNGLNDIYCYDDIDIPLTATDEGLPGNGTFHSVKGALDDQGDNTAVYHLAEAGFGIDTVTFTYLNNTTEYWIRKVVKIDSIGNISILGLADGYCEDDEGVTINALVGNGEGSGNFTGPSAGFANLGNAALIDPSDMDASATPYEVTYTFTSDRYGSGCTKSLTKPFYVHALPTLDFDLPRPTFNVNELPVALTGDPPAGVFSGEGVSEQAGNYVFNPSVAGLGDVTIQFAYTDLNGCYNYVQRTADVIQSAAAIEGIDSDNQYCFDGSLDTLHGYSSNGLPGGSFSGPGISAYAPAYATFNPALAGPGDHLIVYTYFDQYGTRFTIQETLNVDYIAPAEILNLTAGDEFCANEAAFDLIALPVGGVLTGEPVDGDRFNPALADIGANTVTYRYTNESTGCYQEVNVPVVVHAQPEPDFAAPDVCVINNTDTTFFVNQSSSADPIVSWSWNFDDINSGEANFSTAEEPGHLYLTAGPRSVRLTATTDMGCAKSVSKTVDLGLKPNADFKWLNDCYHEGETIQFEDLSTSATPIVGREWTFSDGGNISNQEDPAYPFPDLDIMEVSLVISNGYGTCTDTAIKTVYIRPTFVLKDASYSEDFEDGMVGWSTEGSTGVNSWKLGVPEGDLINTAFSGDTAWYTQINSPVTEDSRINSPCFDFREAERPMLLMHLWRDFDENRDGAVLQSSINNGETWENVGTLNGGLEWYNSFSILGRPGGQQVGWTTEGKGDEEWTEVRHDLDHLIGEKDVKFRLAYGSNGSNLENEGLAFDDFQIISRERYVLFEHFTNGASANNLNANTSLNTLMDENRQDVVDIQYHTDFPGADPLYTDNQEDVSARVLFYGLSVTPYTYLDGGGNVNNRKQYDYVLASVNEQDLTRRVLLSPGFELEVEKTVSGEMLTVDVRMKAMEDIANTDISLYIVVIEREITGITAPNGENRFKNVVKKMLPDAAGTNYKKSWDRNEEVVVSDSWVLENVYDADQIEVVAFVQNTLSREVYQASTTDESGMSTAVIPVSLTEGHFALYPNPANDGTNVILERAAEDDTEVRVLDMQGRLVLTDRMEAGQQSLPLPTEPLTPGIYFVHLRGHQNYKARKLIVTR